MTTRFDGGRVLITGASAGIGRAAALAFVVEGALVLAVARSRERLDAVAAACRGPGRIIPLVADVSDGISMEGMAARVLSEHGPPDVIVANAGIGLDATFVETTDEAFRAVLEVNVLGVMRTVRPFLAGMIGRARGRILLISSVVGKRGIPNYTAYTASKFALHGMADALRVELHGTGVSVGLVCPSSTATEFDERKLRSGPSQRSVRLARHSAESVAQAILRMSRSRRREMVLSPEGKLMMWANALCPSLLDAILARVLVRK